MRHWCKEWIWSTIETKVQTSSRIRKMQPSYSSRTALPTVANSNHQMQSYRTLRLKNLTTRYTLTLLGSIKNAFRNFCLRFQTNLMVCLVTFRMPKPWALFLSLVSRTRFVRLHLPSSSIKWSSIWRIWSQCTSRMSSLTVKLLCQDSALDSLATFSLMCREWSSSQILGSWVSTWLWQPRANKKIANCTLISKIALIKKIWIINYGFKQSHFLKRF